MNFTRQTLAAASVKLAAFAALAAKSGRAEDAAALTAGAEACATAAERFATGNPLVREDAADAERVRASFFDGCREVPGADPSAEACPWSLMAVCIGCGWKDKQWIFSGRRYECLTAHACRVQRELLAGRP